MRRSDPLVSIGLPVYNGENYLALAVESLLGQTYENIELIISDNASTDRTCEIARRFEMADARVRYVRKEQNVGVLENFNGVFPMSAGKYFMWASHDDIWHRDFVTELVTALESSPDIVLAFSGIQRIDASGNHIGDPYQINKIKTDLDPVKRAMACVKMGGGSVIHGLIRSEIMSKTSLLKSMGFPSDIAFVAELSLYGEFYFSPKALFNRRKHKKQTNKTQKDSYYTYRPKGSFFMDDRLERWIDSMPLSRLENEEFRRFFEREIRLRNKGGTVSQKFFKQKKKIIRSLKIKVKSVLQNYSVGNN